MSQQYDSPEFLPLTPGQRAVWLHHRMLGQSTAYHICRFYRIDGVPEVSALSEAVRTVCQRHEALRLQFPLIGGEPVQRIGSLPSNPMQVIRMEDALSEQELLRRIEAAAYQPFDVESGGLFRTFLFHNRTHSIFLIAMHHLVVDGRCIAILMRELSTLYSAYAGGANTELGSVELTYSNWVRREATRLQCLPNSDLEFWRSKMASPPPARGIEAVASNGSTTAVTTELQIPSGFWAPFEALEASARVSRFVACLSAYAALEYRLTGRDDLVLGVPAVRRGEPDALNTVGLLLDVLPLRLRLSEKTTFRELLLHAHQELREALEHASVPLTRIMTEADSPSPGRTSPPFATLFNRIRDSDPLQLGNLPVGDREWIEQDTRFPLTLYLMGADSNVWLRASYQRDLFPPGLVEGLLKQLLCFLANGISDPDVPISTHPLLSPQDCGVERSIDSCDPLLPGKAHRRARTGEDSLLDRVQRWAQQDPSRLAVTSSAQNWDYAEVWSRTSDVARALQAAGIQRGDRVAIYLDRSEHLVPALLGVMAAGAAFVVLNPAYPPSRIALQVEAAQPQAWLTARDTAPPTGVLATQFEAIVCLNLPAPPIGEAVGGETFRPQPDDLAYIAFTSGTTGTPLGVLGEHGPLTHFLEWHTSKWELGEHERFSLFSGIGHDPLLRDLFTPLWVGGVLCVPPAGALTDSRSLAQWLVRSEISTSHLTPALSRMLAHGATSIGAAFAGLRNLFLAGEALTWKDFGQLRRTAPNARIINYYGTTETPQGIAFYEADETVSTPSVPVGQGIDGVELQVRSSRGTLAGVWEPGEILVRTPYLCRGYLNADRRTADRFIAAEGSVREFLTGDRGRYLPDGSVEILDRTDAQINLLGYRIEPGDVRAALMTHPLVQECVVEAPIRPHGDRQLVAYVGVMGPITATELRCHVADLLPAHMIPGQFEILSHLPLTPNGKIDVAALPAVSSMPPDEAPDRPPTPAEERLADLWRELLCRERVGINESFFALGGNSLLSVILLDRIQRDYGRLLPLSAFLHSPTVAQMAQLLEHDPAQEPQADGCLVPLQERGWAPPLFLIHGIGGGVLNYRSLAEFLGSDQPCYALQAPALAGLPHEFETIEEVADRYLREVRQLQPTGPYYLGGQSFGGTVAYEMARQLRSAGEEVALIALLDTRGPGYPRYRPLLQRLVCHLKQFWSNDTAARKEYLRVRLGAVKEILVRALLFRLYRRLSSPSGTLPKVLQDIGLSHTEASRQYRRLPIHIPLVLFRAAEQPPGAYADPYCGWSELVQGPFEVVDVPGDHVSLVEEPHVRVLAERLAEALQRARAGTIGQSRPEPIPVTGSSTFDRTIKARPGVRLPGALDGERPC